MHSEACSNVFKLENAACRRQHVFGPDERSGAQVVTPEEKHRSHKQPAHMSVKHDKEPCCKPATILSKPLSLPHAQKQQPQLVQKHLHEGESRKEGRVRRVEALAGAGACSMPRFGV